MGKKFKSGFVAIVGRPNAGKSTLLNKILGEKITIVSNKPQTTRTNIQGVLTGEDYQVVYIDTPGFHNARDRINKMMVKQARESLNVVDVIYLIVQPDESMGPELKELFKLVKESPAKKILLINKVDNYKRELVYEKAQKFFPEMEFNHVLPISALKGTNIDKLIELTVEELEEGMQFYDSEEITTQPEKLLVAEFVREQAFAKLKDELPYQILVECEDVEDKSDGSLYISASIIVNRESQKGIVIGKQGQQLKTIGTEARKNLENFFGVRVYLDLWVKVRQNWAEQDDYLRMQGLE